VPTVHDGATVHDDANKRVRQRLLHETATRQKRVRCDIEVAAEYKRTLVLVQLANTTAIDLDHAVHGALQLQE